MCHMRLLQEKEISVEVESVKTNLSTHHNLFVHLGNRTNCEHLTRLANSPFSFANIWLAGNAPSITLQTNPLQFPLCIFSATRRSEKEYPVPGAILNEVQHIGIDLNSNIKLTIFNRFRSSKLKEK